MNPRKDEHKPTQASDLTARPGFAVVGLGKMGIMHASMLGAAPSARVAALVDRDLKLCRHVQSMGIEAPVFESVEEAIESTRPEGVILSTPQFTHRMLLEACLNRATPVFCEKPMAHTLDDARAMAAAAAARPALPVAFGYMLGHNPVFEQGARMLAEGVIGPLCTFKASCRLSQVFSPKKGWTFTQEKAGGGVLINSGCHLLFVLHRLLGLPRRVFARGTGVHNEVEDAMMAILDYDDGLSGQIEITWSVPGHELQTHDIELVGKDGVLQLGNRQLKLWLPRANKGWPSGWTCQRRSAMEPRAPFTLSPEYCGDEFYLQIEDFVRAVREGRAPRVGAEPAFAVQRLVDTLYRAIEQRREVTLEEGGDHHDAG